MVIDGSVLILLISGGIPQCAAVLTLDVLTLDGCGATYYVRVAPKILAVTQS